MHVKRTLDQGGDVKHVTASAYMHLPPFHSPHHMLLDILLFSSSLQKYSTRMGHPSLSLLLLILSIFYILGAVEAGPAFPRQSRGRAYIEASCRTTRYPALCIQYLGVFANPTIQTPERVAQVALSVSLYRALYTRSYILNVARELKAMKSKDYQAVKDCLDQINDSVEQLSQSIRELHRLGAPGGADNDDIFWHINNVETWVSSAMTNANTCVDELPGSNMSKLKATIKGKVLNVAETASNALTLFHRYAARYKP